MAGERKSIAGDVADQAADILAIELAILEEAGEDLREMGVRAIRIGADIVTEKMLGADTTIAETALASAVQSIKAAGMVEIAARIRSTLVGLFGLVVRTALSRIE